MAVPKKKLSKRRTRQRRNAPGHGQVKAVHLAKCSNCGSPVNPHRVCANCGFYKGKQIVAKLAA